MNVRGYEGVEAFRNGTFGIGRGKGAFGEQGLYFAVCDIVLVWEFGWTVIGVHQVAGSFGLGGQESSQNLGAREPDRLCS